MSDTVAEMIDQIFNNQNVRARKSFNESMHARLREALDTERIKVAGTIYNDMVEEDFENLDDDDYEDDDDDYDYELDEERLDELSSDTLKSYRDKANKDATKRAGDTHWREKDIRNAQSRANRARKAGKSDKEAEAKADKAHYQKKADLNRKKMQQRDRGRERASSKLASRGEGYEFDGDRLDELSNKTMKSYMKKAGSDHQKASGKFIDRETKGEDEADPKKAAKHFKAAEKAGRRSDKRRAGITRAGKKMGHDSKATSDHLDNLAWSHHGGNQEKAAARGDWNKHVNTVKNKRS